MPGTVMGAGNTGRPRCLSAHHKKEQNWMRAVNAELETKTSDSSLLMF